MQIFEEAQEILPQVQEMLPRMSKSEKAQLMQWLVSDLTDVFPGIEKTPGVCGGDACIAGTRMPVWSLVNVRKLGLTDEKILEEFPTMTVRDLSNAWNYYMVRKPEIDAQILENQGEED